MNRILYAMDCLDVLNDEVALPSSSVDLIYLDPPFNSKSKYNLPFKDELKKDLKPVEAFKDIWDWGEKEDAYLTELNEGPSKQVLADVVKLARNIAKNSSGGGGRCKSSRIPDKYGHAVGSDEESSKGYRKYLSSLRPNCKSLSQVNFGCDLWG